MDSWQRFNETSLRDKKGFYRSLTIEDITDSDYKHAKNRLWRFQDTKLRRVLWIISTKWYTAIAADILPELLQQVHRNIQSLSQAFFLTPILSWKTGFKKPEVELKLLTDVDMPLMVEKNFRGRIYCAVHWYAKVSNK